MALDQLIVSFPTNRVSKLKAKFSGCRQIRYVYFGRNFFARRSLEQALGNSFVRLDMAKVMDEVATEIRHEHVQWIDRLNRKYGKNLEWWFGSISSRNIYVSHLFQYTCYLEILARLWQTPSTRPALVFVESPGLARTICTWAEQQRIDVSIVPARVTGLNLYDYVISFSKWGYFCLQALARCLAALGTKKNGSLPKVTAQPLAIVDTFVIDADLNNEGVFTDRYFPSLYDYLAENGYQVLIHPVLYDFHCNFFPIMRRLRQSSMKFIIAEDFLTLRDYFWVMFFPLRTLRQKVEAEHFHGFDLAELLQEERRRNFADNSSLLAGLVYRLFLRLGQHGLRPQIIINLYENQVIDKALIAAARRAFPQSKILGAQLFIHLSNMLNLFPCQSEVEAGVAPHLLLAVSRHQCSVARSFAPGLPCYPVAALRHGHLFPGLAAEGDSHRKKRAVLVLLPFEVAESVEMLETLKMGLDHIAPDAEILVKVHPILPPSQLLKTVGDEHWPRRFRIFSGPISQALQEAAVVISSNSGAILEAVAYGIPVLFMARQTVLNQKIMVDMEIDLIRECFSTEDLVVAVNRNLHLSPEEEAQNRETGKKVRELLFEPITSKNMLPFLGVVD